MNRREFVSSSFYAALPLGFAAAPSSSANETIERARQAAMDVLKPTRKDLEHGLELHANSLVFESYGFSPTSAVDGDALQSAINAGASAAEVQDLQEEMWMTRHVTVPAEQKEYKEAWDVHDELAYIRIFFQLGLRMMHLTYNRRNMLADGCAESANRALSDMGRAAIAEMNRVGVVVDVAHSGWKTSFEAASEETYCAWPMRPWDSNAAQVAVCITKKAGGTETPARPAVLLATGRS